MKTCVHAVWRRRICTTSFRRIVGLAHPPTVCLAPLENGRQRRLAPSRAARKNPGTVGAFAPCGKGCHSNRVKDADASSVHFAHVRLTYMGSWTIFLPSPLTEGAI